MKLDTRLSSITDCLYRVSLKAAIVNENKLLVVKEPEDWYGLPGGGLDYGESILQGLERELHEEVGLTASGFRVRSLQPAWVTTGAKFKGIPFFNVFYDVELLEPIQANTELKYEWVGPAAFEQLRFGPTLTIARDYLRSLFQA